MKIPNIIHFIYVSDNPSDGQLTLPHYLAVKSAAVVNQPDRILFHYGGHEPSGEWWEKIKQVAQPRLVKVPSQIHGRPLVHPAHKADVIRLQMLKEYGGIYLDIDTISVRSLAPFRKYSFVIGKQTSIFPWNWKQRLKKCLLEGTLRYLRRPLLGVCNAVLLSEAQSPFLEIWLDSYKTFRSSGRDEYWAEHSSIVPIQLARENPGLVYMASEWAFHYPLFDDAGLQDMFVHNKRFSRAYIHHLWQAFSEQKYLKYLTVDKIKTQDTTYNVMARRYL